MNPLLIEEIIQLSIAALHGVIAMHQARQQKQSFGKTLHAGVLAAASALPTILAMTALKNADSQGTSFLGSNP